MPSLLEQFWLKQSHLYPNVQLVQQSAEGVFLKIKNQINFPWSLQTIYRTFEQKRKTSSKNKLEKTKSASPSYSNLVRHCGLISKAPRTSVKLLFYNRMMSAVWKYKLFKNVTHISTLKGSVSRDFRPPVFFMRRIINRLKYFRIRFKFRQDILSQSCLGGVQHTTEIISAVCKGVHHTMKMIFVHTTETISAVCNPPQRWSPRSATNRGDKLQTGESKSESSLVYGCF